MKPKILKNDFDYEKALEYIEILMAKEESTENNEEIELFTTLISNYEDKFFSIDLPNPIDAILFVMDHKNLKRKDLIPIIGSQSKVSEILNRKRPLSLTMIRNLNTELKIPAEILLQDTEKKIIPLKKFEYSDYPVSEMFKLGYFSGYNKISQVKDYFEDIMTELFDIFSKEIPNNVYCKQANVKNEPNNKALVVWQAHILKQISFEKIDDFSLNTLDDNFFEGLLALSTLSKGPLLVKDYLNSFGIYFKIEQHLSKTYLDGATFKAVDNKPIIGLTLRHDRLDNFWFTLIHELSHVVKHLYKGDEERAFFDDTFSNQKKQIPLIEQEANNFSMEYLVPSSKISNKDLCNYKWTSLNIKREAKRIKRSPAILAGRIRHETGNFSIFTDMLGINEVRYLFKN